MSQGVGLASCLPKTALASDFVPVWAFALLYPNVLPASNNDAFSLTIHNASSSPYTLKVMTVVALLFTPVVLAYQAWTYWVFRKRLGLGDIPAATGLPRTAPTA